MGTWGRIGVVGRGRVGGALCAARGLSVGGLHGPFGRGFDGHADGLTFDTVILAVPDDAIADAARPLREGMLVGHCAGSLGLDVLSPHEAFGMHPLMTVPDPTTEFHGAGAAVAGSSARALAFATELARSLGMSPVTIADDDRGAYHAAASIASNFLVALEDAAERLLATCDAPRSLLVPLVRATVENWAANGGAALTGPIARGDTATVERQRAAVAERHPEMLELFDAMCALTRSLAARLRVA